MLHDMTKMLLDSTVGRSVASFIAKDMTYMAVLIASGALMLVGYTSTEQVFMDVLFGFYKVLILMTVAAYLFLRLIRKKKYSKKENESISEVGLWVAGSVVASLFILLLLFSINDILEMFNIGIFGELWALFSLIFSIWLLLWMHKSRRMSIANFSILMIDGLAWLMAIGGVSALAIMDFLYLLFLLWDKVGLIY